MSPVRFERRNEPRNDDKIVINVGKEDKMKENEINITNKRREDILRLIRSKSTNDIKKQKGGSIIKSLKFVAFLKKYI